MADYEKPIMHGVTAAGDKKPILLGNDGGLGLSISGGVSVDFGTKINDSTLGAGGAGNLGWLSSIWKLINDRIPALVSGKIPVVMEGGGGTASPSTATVTANTTAVTGNFQAIQILTEANFSAFTMTGLTGSMTGFAIPAGITIFGNITAYTLASGRVIAYGVN